MIEGLRQLLELQRLDTEIAAREEELASLPGRRKQLEEESAAAAVKQEEAREAVRTIEAAQRKAEAMLQDQEALLKRLEGQQFQVKDNTAYTALLHEMERAKQLISDYETEILEDMDAIEEARANLAAAETRDREARERGTAEARNLEERERQLRDELAELARQREEIGPKLDASILSVYEKIAARRRPALVLVSNEICGGCRVGIPAQNYIEILKGERIVTCDHCHRILLHLEMAAAPADR